MRNFSRLVLIVTFVVNTHTAMAELGQGISFNKYQVNTFNESATFSFPVYDFSYQTGGMGLKFIDPDSLKAGSETLRCDPQYTNNPYIQCETQSLKKIYPYRKDIDGNTFVINPCYVKNGLALDCRLHSSYVSSCVQAHQSQCFTTRWMVTQQQAQDLANRVAFLENLLNTQHQEEIDALNNTMSNFREMVKQELLMDLKKTLEVIDGGEGKKVQLEITIKSEDAEVGSKGK